MKVINVKNLKRITSVIEGQRQTILSRIKRLKSEDPFANYLVMKKL
jgi:hypothetical protein